MTLEEAKQYIQSVRWQYAKTYKTTPHEYTVLDWYPENCKQMISFADFILENGYLEIYDPKKIIEFVEEYDGQRTAICPYCETDSVIGKSSGYPITKKIS